MSHYLFLRTAVPVRVIHSFKRLCESIIRSMSYVPPGVLTFLQGTWIQQCSVVAGSALVLYDHLSTLFCEFQVIWTRRNSSVTILFHLNRWLILAWAVLQITNSFLPLLPLPSCAAANHLNNAVSLLLSVVWAAFSAVRIYAISTGNWLLASVVFSLSLVPVGTNAYAHFTTFSFQAITLPVIGTFCDATTQISETLSIKVAISTRVCVITADVIILLTTWLKTYSIQKHATRANMKSPLATILLVDGTAYFLLLLALNIMDIIGFVLGIFIWTVGAFTIPLSAVIISHFLLNLRRLSYEPEGSGLDSHRFSSGSINRGSIRFAPFVDNMGELVDQGDNPSDCWEDFQFAPNNSGTLGARQKICDGPNDESATTVMD
ncbi:hypothetical protein OBBRIDRAFT_792065 [Obba rivulosa]|uniref:DUF6533 domain-containing protein n=1 Tax=Obba rivulosa TaxID=1052685 RepID=A0A8E2B0D2_9APHY|nr:hypothetical protein OBBRIDRAFT_792065 [Obba rivulosa]